MKGIRHSLRISHRFHTQYFILTNENDMQCSLLCSPSIIGQIKSRRMRWAEHVERREEYRVLVGKPEGKRPLGRPRRRWDDGIRMDLGRLSGRV
jgi:hypothetical protein